LVETARVTDKPLRVLVIAEGDVVEVSLIVEQHECGHPGAQVGEQFNIVGRRQLVELGSCRFGYVFKVLHCCSAFIGSSPSNRIPRI
jgi:hypothetical protein